MGADEQKKTPKDIEYFMPETGAAIVIPAGTPVISAEGSVEDGSSIAYFAEAWEGMPEEAVAHMEKHGFGLRAEDVDGDESEASVPVEGAEVPAEEQEAADGANGPAEEAA